MWHLYILRACDGTLYTGITLDVKRRIKTHHAGKGSRYLRGRLPAKLVYRESLPDRSSALKREARIKRMARREKLALIAGAS